MTASVVTGLALGGSVLPSLAALDSSAHDRQSAGDRSRAGTAAVVRASYDDDDRTAPDTRGLDDSDDADDSDQGGSDDGLDGSDDPVSGYSAHAGSGYRTHATASHPTRVSNRPAPHAGEVAGRRPVRTVGRHWAAGTTGRAAHTRPMSSGEQQYRNGCRQGYIVEDCGQYDVPHLLQRGINPYL